MTRKTGVKVRAVYISELIEKYINNGWHNIAEFSRFLSKVDEKQGNEAAWRMNINRFMKANNLESLPKPAEFADEEDGWLSGEDYYYDKHNDRYITSLKMTGSMVVVDGDTHRMMKNAYSDFTGKGYTISQMALKFGFPRQWISEYVKVHRWKHEMDPYTDEDMLTRNVDDMIDDIIEKQRMGFMKKAEAKMMRQMKKDAEAFNELDYYLLNEFRSLLADVDFSARYKPIKLETPISEYVAVISPTDFHWGKYGWEDETGDAYDFGVARSRLISKTQNLIGRLPGQPEKIIVPTGSDWFHIDTDFATTTKGTPQDVAGSPGQIMMSGCEMAREHIEMLRAVAPIQVVFMPGNHDRMSSLALMMYLSAVYENAEDVEVVINASTRQYIVWKENLLGFTHGDSIKPDRLPSLMAQEQRKEWGLCENHVWFHGHLHHRSLTESNGAFVVQLPSLAGSDRYHARHGYRSRPGLCAHIIDCEQGLVGSLYAPVMEHEE